MKVFKKRHNKQTRNRTRVNKQKPQFKMQYCEEDPFVQKQRPFTRRKPGTDLTSLTECQLSPVRRGEVR